LALGSRRVTANAWSSIRWLPRWDRRDHKKNSKDLLVIWILRSVMHFEYRLASGPDDICNLFAYFIQQTYADDAWVPSDPESDLLVPFSSLWMRYRVCCWSWMSANMWAPMTCRLLFWRTVHPLLRVHLYGNVASIFTLEIFEFSSQFWNTFW
jgi:hypothetical protein